MHPTIAVLPLYNPDQPSWDYLAEGLTDLLNETIRRAGGFRVLSKESLHHLEDRATPAELTMEQLGVELILDARLSVSERIAIEVRLLTRDQEVPLLQEVITAELREVLDIGNRLIRRVSEVLLPEGETPQANKHMPVSRQAYRAYLFGNHYLAKWDRAYSELAFAQFEKVTDLEPDFVPAYLGIVKAYVFLASRGYRKPSQVYPECLRIIERMIPLYPEYGELYLYKGIIQFFYELDWANAYANIERGLQYASDASDAYSQLSYFWYGMRKYDRAIEAIYTAKEYNPLSTELLNMLGDVQLSSKDYDAAEKTFLSIMELQPEDKVSLENLMYIHALQGNMTQTKHYLRRLTKGASEDVMTFPRLGFVYGRLGRKKQAIEAIQTIRMVMEKEANTVHYNRLANVYAGLREWEKALDCVEKAFAARTGILFVLTDPQFEPVRMHRRFLRLEREVRMPDVLLSEPQLTIQSDLKAQLSFNPEQFLYARAEENYSVIVLYNNFRIEEKLLRISISKLLLQLPEDQFFRCHRSYIVNQHIQFDVSGNARGYTLRSPRYNFEVPVSRSKIGEMRERLGESTRS